MGFWSVLRPPIRIVLETEGVPQATVARHITTINAITIFIRKRKNSETEISLVPANTGMRRTRPRKSHSQPLQNIGATKQETDMEYKKNQAKN